MNLCAFHFTGGRARHVARARVPRPILRHRRAGVCEQAGSTLSIHSYGAPAVRTGTAGSMQVKRPPGRARPWWSWCVNEREGGTSDE
ncbi:hypothetical protein GCM10010274_44510 [Streptomyces lavendofoliae]|uniref:Uncharacterized protein n=1 Tax=Streptomyces lavendofoliae TaxID=67314 RepID=A0A918I0M2_9ACTN|nr:hypothetical protein GCM10010274_44510 [Streptomyces lavendofoliae]